MEREKAVKEKSGFDIASLACVKSCEPRPDQGLYYPYWQVEGQVLRTLFSSISSERERLEKGNGGFPGCPVVKTSSSSSGGLGSIPGQELRFPGVSWLKTKT